MHYLFVLAFVLFSAMPVYAEDFCYFLSPKNWEAVDARSLNAHVKMGFVQKGKEGFCPSLNLVIEEVEGSLNDYLNDVKAIHEKDKNTQWRKLGKVRTACGEAQLTEIDTASHFGPVRMLQLILLKEGKAYIVTAAALKKNFCEHYREFQDAFRSLNVTQDLFEGIPQLERKNAMRQAQEKLFEAWKTLSASSTSPSTSPESLFASDAFQKKHWKPFEKMVEENFQDMRAFWQILVLLETRNQLLPNLP